MNYKLPIYALVAQVFLLPRTHINSLIKVATPLALVGIFWLLWIPEDVSHIFAKDSNALGKIIALAMTAFLLLALVKAIVGCHRIYILGDTAKDSLSYFKGAGTELAFSLWWLLLVIAFAGVGIGYSVVVTVPVTYFHAQLGYSSLPHWALNLLLGLPLQYVFCRWSVLLPAVAVGVKDVSLSWAWRLSRGNGWRLTLLLVALPFVMKWLLGLLPLQGSFMTRYVYWLIWMVVGAIEVGLLSKSFNCLVTNVGTEQTKPSIA